MMRTKARVAARVVFAADRQRAATEGGRPGVIRRGLGALACAAALATAVLAAPTPTMAQSAYSPVARIDGMVITKYEFDQRLKFLTLLHAPGDVRKLTMDQLINEKLQLRVVREAGTTVDDAAVKAGMDEFAARGNLTGDQFVQLLAQAGVNAATFRDFVKAGVAWRDYVRQNLLPKVNLSEAEIDEGMAVAQVPPGVRFLLSEIVLPASDPATRKASMARAKRLTGLDEKAFGEAAMRFSIGPSRNNEGKLKWADVTALPDGAGPAVRGLKPGQTSRIIQSKDKITIYFVRDRETVSRAKPATEVEYAALLLPGGQSPANQDEAARIRAKAVTCDNLYPIARGLAPEQFSRQTVLESAVPATYAAALADLDPGEISSSVTTPNGAMAVLMLCRRGNVLPRSLTRDAVASQLKNQRVGAMAQQMLDDLRANADVEILRP